MPGFLPVRFPRPLAEPAVPAGATYAATTVLGHTLAQRVDPVALTTCATTAGAVALAPFLVIAVLDTLRIKGRRMPRD